MQTAERTVAEPPEKRRLTLLTTVGSEPAA